MPDAPSRPYSGGPASPPSAGASGNRVAPRIISRSGSENMPLKRSELITCSRCSGGIPRKLWIAVFTARWRAGGSCLI
jgi:hypothetical protein